MGARIIKGKTWPENTESTTRITQFDKQRWPEFPREDRNKKIDSALYASEHSYDKVERGGLGSNEFDENRDWGQRGQSHLGYQGGYGHGYGQQERGARGQHVGYFGSSAPIEESTSKPRVRASKNSREGYSDSDTRNSRAKIKSADVKEQSARSTSSKPRKESKLIVNDKASPRGVTSGNRSRSTTGRGRY